MNWYDKPQPHEDQVLARMAQLRREYPDGDYPDAWSSHDTGECIECDAIRRLDAEALDA